MPKLHDGIVTVYNKSNQLISVCIAPPNGDFYMHMQFVHILPRKEVKLPASYVNNSQIANLQKSGQLQITTSD